LLFPQAVKRLYLRGRTVARNQTERMALAQDGTQFEQRGIFYRELRKQLFFHDSSNARPNLGRGEHNTH
jgi:hypothetical protein